MNLRKLSIFKGVVDANSFSGAATQLFISQPAVSKAIKDLESELSCVLLGRHAGQLVMTQAGETLYAYASSVLELERSVLAELRRQRGLEEGELIIGATRDAGTFFVPPLIVQFLDRHPAIDVHLASANKDSIEQRLGRFELDVAFLESPLDDPGVDCRYWRDETLVILACADSPLADQTQIDTDALSTQRWILSEPGSGRREHSLELLRDGGIQVSQIMEVEGSGTVIQCVAAGLGVSLVSERAARAHLMAGRVRIVPFPIEFHRALFVATLRSKPTSPAAAEFLQMARAAAKSEKAG